MLTLYNHGGSGNHGCEAIVRSTVQILNEPIRLLSAKPSQDFAYGLDSICQIRPDTSHPILRGSVPWLLSALETRLTGKIDLSVFYQKREIFQQVSKGDWMLSIGGDNYCYSGTDLLAAVNTHLRRRGVKLCLWGCSVDPKVLKNPVISRDLARYDLITAREIITYEALKTINPETILVPDPAFTLPAVHLPLPEGWQSGKMVGLNVSPLFLKAARNPELLLEACRTLIRHILDNTDFSVALIPHVVWSRDDDRAPLESLYRSFSHTGRVLLLADCNCMELKGYISRCRLFLGARTHATIAAYSSCVPTIALGYSLKARGIARDLFGTEENYVLEASAIRTPTDLTDAFRWLLQREDTIRSHLHSTMPQYIRRAYDAADALERLRETGR